MKQISLYTKDQCRMLLKPHGLDVPTSKEHRMIVTTGGIFLFRKVKSRGKIFYELQFGWTYDLCKPEDRLFHIDD